MKLLNDSLMLLPLLALAYTAVTSLQYTRNDFPPDFVFGSGTSAYQVEGAANEDGRTPSIWDVFAHAGHSGVAAADVACDQYHKYKEDVKLMADIGLEAYKFSISWSRLLPSGRGPVNPKGLQYYNNLIDELVTHGIQPHVTLHHFDLPQALEDEYGGWLSQESVRDFTAYANTCFKEFGDRVSHWTTINEVNVFALGGYDAGITPPARCSPPFGLNCSSGNSSVEPYIAVHNILLAHASATNLYKKQYKVLLSVLFFSLPVSHMHCIIFSSASISSSFITQYKQHGSVGISVYAYGVVPLTNSVEDKQATARVNDFYIGWILHPLVFGDYPETMKTNVGSRLPAFTKEESEQIKGAFDFVGVIHYMTIYVKDNSSSLKPNPQNFITDLAAELTLFGNTTFENEHANTPWSLEQILLYIKESYENPPVYILENGQVTPHSSSLEDTPRIKYLSSYIEAVLHSLRKGANVKGYFQWSLMDVFELFGGYEKSYGLYYVDFKDPNLKRTPKLSAHWYSSFLMGTQHQPSHASS
ncbi:PREDICTED: beta-glucosidase 11 isoform X1 [Camelina sativa]|uniref:Beta-glucosidase 11 isoform X1 n=1 Tax=Camelina sativa TaxID=90675 RepID=A0ABM0WQV2_CAMSA|nr:PREDICTED: beta-glucosidase 11 isoform X1 [Camelina sativa]